MKITHDNTNHAQTLSELNHTLFLRKNTTIYRYNS